MPQSRAKLDAAGTAKLLVLLLALAWGFNWIAAWVALREVSPWSLRFAGSGIGAVTLFAAAVLTGHKLRVPRGEYLHVMVAGFFNVAAFQILSGFAQLSGASRDTKYDSSTERLIEIIDRCLQVDPKLRFANALSGQMQC